MPVGGVTVSRTGMAGRLSCESGVSVKTFHSLLVLLELMEPSRVNVPSAKTEAVTSDKIVSAIMLDVKSTITYC